MAIEPRALPSTPVSSALDDVQDDRLLRILERPDGYHWIDAEGRQEFGPYESQLEALAAMDDSEEALEKAISQAEATAQAERELDVEVGEEPVDEDESDAGPR